MKILTLDIEMAPNIVHRWQLYGNDSTGLSQLIQPQELMCVAWKWLDKDQTYFMRHGRYHKGGLVLGDLHADLEDADVVITYNGKKFDIPRLNTAFLEDGFPPPKPYAHIDLYQVCRKVFGFPSNKLDYITNRLLGHGKVSNGGHDLWVACMMGDEGAWELMQKYNEEDVRITEDLYTHIKGWIPAHPNVLLYDELPGVKACPKCGNNHIQRRGYAHAATGVYQQYQCRSCFGWFRDVKRIDGSTVR